MFLMSFLVAGIVTAFEVMKTPHFVQFRDFKVGRNIVTQSEGTNVHPGCGHYLARLRVFG